MQWTLGPVIIGAWLGFAAAARERVSSPLRTLANLLEAMREGDYSIRARGARFEDALGEVMQQVNAMGATLRAQRLGALEATTLLRKVMEEIDVAIFAFDQRITSETDQSRGRAPRRATRPSVSSICPRSRSVSMEFLIGEATRTVQRTFRGASGAGASAAASSAKEDCHISFS